jgi:hypothetical protein
MPSLRPRTPCAISSTIRPTAANRRQFVESLERRILMSANITASGTQSAAPQSPVNISNTPGFPREAEMLVAVNPQNPLNIAVVTGTGGSTQIHKYWTKDGGRTWGSNDINPSFDGDVNGRYDPSLAFDSNGTLYIAYISGGAGMRIATSTDGGSHLQTHPGISPPGSHFPDKAMIGVGIDPNQIDQTTGKPAVAVYLAWGTFTTAGIQVTGAYGSDILSWTSGSGPFADVTSVAGSTTNSTFPQPIVGPNGELYVSWTTVFESAIYVSRDLDGLRHSTGVPSISFGSPSLAYQDAASGLY